MSAAANRIDDYYPFGFQMVGRGKSGPVDAYRYGFNGMEKDDEVSGSGNSYTAEHWQYDSRLSRRWNVDPVVKSWQSSYLTFSNSPLFKVDPNGDDDFFNKNGTYILSTRHGTAIRITNNVGITEEVALSIQEDLPTLKNYNYSNENNRTMLSNVATHYAAKVGINKQIQVRQNDLAAASTKKGGKGTSDDVFSIFYTKEGGLTGSGLDDINNMTNTWAHEKIHQSDPFAKKAGGEITAIIGQMEHSSWDKTTESFKKSIVAYAVKDFNKLLNGGATFEEIAPRIESVNKGASIGNVKVMYFKEINQVISITTKPSVSKASKVKKNN